MEKVDIIVIGAGVVGLAVGHALAKNFDDVVIVEKEDSYGRHTSSRNSEVIHSGIYYPKDSFKKELCIEGRELLYDFLNTRNLPYSQCGKLVVAVNEEEIPALNALYENGVSNGLNDLEKLSKEECKAIAPEVIAEKAILVPVTGILNTHRYMQQLKIEFEENGGFILFDMEAEKIKKTDDGFAVSFSNGEEFLAEKLINCAGLQCEDISRLVGLNTEELGLKIHWCKAEYYKTSEKFKLNKLIYPLPDPTGMYLGIHLTLNLAGEVRFGPSAYYVDELDYSMDERNKEDFSRSVSKYLKFNKDKIHPDDTGIRPKLQGENDGFRDFYIQEESKNGFPGYINLMGIESPGLTASLAIGKFVYKLLKS